MTTLPREIANFWCSTAKKFENIHQNKTLANGKGFVKRHKKNDFIEKLAANCLQ
jgi:hypothetical protein